MLPEYFEFCLPTKVIYGIGILNSLADAFKPFGKRKAILVTDEVLVGTGLVDKVKKGFQGTNINIACVYDDVNDLAMAETCGVRCMIRRAANPLFADFARRRGLCDYISGSRSDRFAVREISELFLGLLGQYEQVVQSRTAFDATYREYFDRRQAIPSRFYRQADEKIIESPRIDEKAS